MAKYREPRQIFHLMLNLCVFLWINQLDTVELEPRQAANYTHIKLILSDSLVARSELTPLLFSCVDH